MTQRPLSTTGRPRRSPLLGVATVVLGLAACAGSSRAEPTVTITSTRSSVVSCWNTTAEEQRPSYHVDLASVHVAIYDAVGATPNHPEYPAAHSWTSGTLGETLRQYYGTHRVVYAFDSAVTGTTRTYATTDALDDESRIARVYGGMHFDFSTAAGVELGTRVAQWVAARHFGRRE
jgi:hypothetical protein